MTKISEAAKAKARKLCAAQFVDNDDGVAAFIQQVSDAAKIVTKNCGPITESHQAVAPFILSEPTDPLQDVLLDVWRQHWDNGSLGAEWLREALAKRGLKIVAAA